MRVCLGCGELEVCGGLVVAGLLVLTGWGGGLFMGSRIFEAKFFLLVNGSQARKITSKSQDRLSDASMWGCLRRGL